MERDVRYLTVGVVVLVLLGASLAFAIWQAGGLEGAERERYTVAFEGDVSGLSQGSSVRYRGVEVGRVTAVRMLADQPEVIHVDIAVRPGTPVTRETVARIQPQGITGMSYIGLSTPSPGPPPQATDGARHPLLASAPSRLERLGEDLPNLAGDLSQVAQRLERALSDENVANLERILDRSAELVGRLNRLGERADGLLGRAGRTLEGVDRATGTARRNLDELGSVAPPAREALVAVQGLSERLDRLVARSGPDVARFSESGLPELRALIGETRTTLREVRGLARSLRENPGQLVAPPKRGGKEVPR